MSKVIIVTGIAGFLGSQIVDQLLKQGHIVRGTARGKKLEEIKKIYAANQNLQLVEVADLSLGQFPELFPGADAVIHTASPVGDNLKPADALQLAIGAALNVLRQAEAAGIKKFVVTGSIAAVSGDPSIKGVSVRREHWNPVTREVAESGTNRAATYAASKKYAELAVWEWAEAHPHVDVTVINPPFLYGPLVTPSYQPTQPDWNFLTSNLIIANLLFPNGEWAPPRPPHVDIRDAAKAHINAVLTSPSRPVEGRKRVILASPNPYVFQEVIDTIRKERPELADRLITAPIPDQPFTVLDIDYDFVEQVVGIKKADFIPLRETLLETVDSLIKLFDLWKVNGHEVKEVVPFSF